jgi:hypothetical protein
MRGLEDGVGGGCGECGLSLLKTWFTAFYERMRKVETEFERQRNVHLSCRIWQLEKVQLKLTFREPAWLAPYQSCIKAELRA